MTTGNKQKYLISGFFFLVFIIFTICVKIIDVQPIGPEGSSVGFAGINGAVHQFFGIQLFWYNLTKIFGYVALLVGASFTFVAAIQFILRKKISLVDRNLISLIFFYIAVMIFYILFEKVIINYRPEIIDAAEGLEASYPSSHTLLILCFMISTVRELKFYIKNKSMLYILQAACFVISILTVYGRLACGVHWFTDIMGGVILSCALLTFPRVVRQKKEIENK